MVRYPRRRPPAAKQVNPRLIAQFGGARTRPEGTEAPKLYVGFVDESGTRPTSSGMVVAGLMIHEEDVWHPQQRLDGFLHRRLKDLGSCQPRGT